MPIFAECAGISEVAASERELVEQLVGRLIPPQTDVPGVTDLVEHHIDMQGAAPIRQKSPKMFEFTKVRSINCYIRELLSRLRAIGEARR